MRCILAAFGYLRRNWVSQARLRRWTCSNSKVTTVAACVRRCRCCTTAQAHKHNQVEVQGDGALHLPVIHLQCSSGARCQTGDKYDGVPCSTDDIEMKKPLLRYADVLRDSSGPSTARKASTAGATKQLPPYRERAEPGRGPGLPELAPAGRQHYRRPV